MELRRIPWTLWVFAVTSCGVIFAVVLIRGDELDNAVVWLALAMILALTVWVLSGSRIAWWIATLLTVFVIVTTPLDPPINGWALALNIITLGALLLRPSRTYCRVAE